MSNAPGFPSDFKVHDACREIVRQCAAKHGKSLEELRELVKNSHGSREEWVGDCLHGAARRGVPMKTLEAILGASYYRIRRWSISGWHRYQESMAKSHTDTSAMPC